jgi:hypothetical protein
MDHNSPTTMTQIRNLLNDLEAAREKILALSDDIWQAIDHNDPDSAVAKHHGDVSPRICW